MFFSCYKGTDLSIKPITGDSSSKNCKTIAFPAKYSFWLIAENLPETITARGARIPQLNVVADESASESPVRRPQMTFPRRGHSCHFLFNLGQIRPSTETKIRCRGCSVVLLKDSAQRRTTIAPWFRFRMTRPQR